MPLPPVESGPAGMTRRNYLVEVNRRRVAHYEPTKKQLEAEDVRLATVRQQEKQQKQLEWTQSRKKAGAADGAAAATTNGSTHAASSGRPLPGANGRSLRATRNAPANENTYQIQREEEAEKKRQYNRLYDQDSKRQLEERRETLRKKQEGDEAQMAALREVNAQQDRWVAEARAAEAEEDRRYMARLKASNVRELATKKAERDAREEQDRQLQRLVNENNRHRAEMDERRTKNATRMLQMQNEVFHIESTKKKQANEAKLSEEMAVIAERDRRLAKEEQEAAQAKKETFRREFAESVARDKEFRERNNYDEPVEVTRQRNELAAQSYRVSREEERLRRSERKQKYREDLMDQIGAKQTYRMTHLDEPGM